MDRNPVKSTSLISVGYSRETQTLEAEFKGGVYDYYEVPERVYEELMASDSLGTYFNRFIRDQYRFSRVSPEGADDQS